MRFPKRLLFLLSLCLCFPLFGLEVSLVKTLGSAPTRMLYGQEGLWWYGMEDGLYRFDGVSLERVKPFGIGRVNMLMEDERGRLWIGTEHGLFFRDSEVRFGPVSLPEDHGRILSLGEADGSLWIGLSDGLMRLKPDHPSAERVFSHESAVRVLFHDMGGALWAGTDTGLFLVEEAAQNIRLQPVRGSVSRIYAIEETTQGTLVVATDVGLTLLDQDREAVHTLGELAKPMIAMGTLQDFVWAMTDQGDLVVYENDVLRESSLPVTNIWTTAMDPFGNLWMASGDGNIYRHGKSGPGPVLKVKSIEVNGKRSEVFINRLVLKEGDQLSVRLHTLDPVSPGGTFSFRYGDTDWVPMGDSGNLFLTSLKRGDSVLEFRCEHASGKILIRELPLRVERSGLGTFLWWGPWFVTLILGALVIWMGRRRGTVDVRVGSSEKVRAYIAKSSAELHEPLTSLVHLSESLLNGSLGDIDERIKESLSMVVASGRRLSRMVDNLTGLAEVNTGSLPMRQQRVDLYALVQVTLTRAERDDCLIGLVNRVPKELPDVLADEDLLLRILNILVSNGIQHTESGEVRVSARHEGEMVCLSVADTGRNLSPEQIRRLFEPEGDESSNPRLGLSYMRQLARQQGGELWGEPRGDGCVFYLTLPVYDESLSGSDTAAFRVPDEVFEELYGARQVPPNGEASHCILVVDDDRINRQVLFNHLALQNYRILVAGGGEEALEIMEKEAVDLVLLDVMMPRVNGYEVCERLRQRWPIQELPVIFLTAKNQEADLLTGYSIGGNDFIGKPVHQTEVLARVKTHLALLDVHRNLENKVVERTDALLHAQKQMVNQEKMASLGTLTAGIAHELKNPLNFVNNFSVFAEDLCRDVRRLLGEARELLPATLMAQLNQDLDEMEENISYVHQYGTRANGIIESMMDLAGNPRDERKLTDINGLVEEFADFVFKGKKAALNRVRIQKNWDPSIGKQEVIAQALSRVIINLVNNAMEAMAVNADLDESFNGALSVTTQMGNRHYTIEIADNGHGIPEDMMNQIFTPFYTSKPPGSGNIGLGLAICYDIVTVQHGGELSVHSSVGRGTTFIVKLPIIKE